MESADERAQRQKDTKTGQQLFFIRLDAATKESAALLSARQRHPCQAPALFPPSVACTGKTIHRPGAKKDVARPHPTLLSPSTFPRSKNRNEAHAQSVVSTCLRYALGESPRTSGLAGLHFQQRTAIEARPPHTSTATSALLPPALFSFAHVPAASDGAGTRTMIRVRRFSGLACRSYANVERRGGDATVAGGLEGLLVQSVVMRLPLRSAQVYGRSGG